tara:strand:- start:64 stop:294 length:231 start_codon:yes stop_codon:yes gene_type:complete
MVKASKIKNDINAAIVELNRIHDEYDIPTVYRNYISFVAWKLERDFNDGPKQFNQGGTDIGQKGEEKEEKTGEKMP